MTTLTDLVPRLVETAILGTARLSAALLGGLIFLSLGETVSWVVFASWWSAAAELQSILLVWFAWSTAVHVAFRGAHITVGAGSPEASSHSWIRTFGIIATGIFGAVTTILGGQLISQVTNTLPATGLNASVHYWPAVVFGPLLLISAIANLRPSPTQLADD